MNEWIIEGRKKWGRSAISEDAQNIRKSKGAEKDLKELIKYSSKIVTKPKNSIEEAKIYPAALHEIFSAMRSRKIICKFGFKISKQKKAEVKTQRLFEFKKVDLFR